MEGWKVDISSSQIHKKQNKDDDFDYLFSIIDPFDLKHNPGQKVKINQPEKVEAIDKAIIKAINTINNYNNNQNVTNNNNLTTIRNLFEKSS